MEVYLLIYREIKIRKMYKYISLDKERKVSNSSIQAIPAILEIKKRTKYIVMKELFEFRKRQLFLLSSFIVNILLSTTYMSSRQFIFIHNHYVFTFNFDYVKSDFSHSIAI